MRKRSNSRRKLRLFSLLTGLTLLNWSAQGQTTPNVTVEILGTGAESLIGGDLTDPENDGEDAAGSASSPTWNWTEITASIEADFEGGENSFNIFDNKVGGGNDKWCCDDPTLDTPVWVAVQFPGVISLTHFTVASGNDSPDRDPTDWAIQGSNDGTAYTDIYHFTDTTVPWTERNQVAKFTLPGPSVAYRYFRYIAYETPGALHQINEIEYFGIVGGANAADTDKDGMPDEYETRMGFNPNDATDAAKDFDADGVSNLDEYKAGTNPIDTTKPTVVSATTTETFDTVRITFSEEVDPATATNLVNYTFSPALAVTAATYKSKVVTLTTAKQTAGAILYTVTVKGVKDTSKNEVPADSKATFFSYLLTKANALKFSYWGGIDGTPVDGLINDPRYPASPDLVAGVFSFNSRDAFPDDSHENYGATMEGFLTPTTSGSYRFFDYSDDASQLFLSTDELPANLVQIAEETGCCNVFTEPDSPRTSEPIALVAGKKYYVRLIYKEGGGGDYGQVAWRLETDKTPAAALKPIPGRFLSSAVDVPLRAEGITTTQTPAANAKNVSPAAKVTIVHIDGKTPWTAANVTLKFNGATVAPTITKDGNQATIVYTPSSLLPSNSTNTVTLTYPDPAGNPATLEWSFVVSAYGGPLTDSVHQYPGLVMGLAKQSADKGGHTAAVGDKGMDFGDKGGASFFVPDASWLNTATASNEMSFSIWVKRYDINASSAFWAVSPSSNNGERGWQAHVPWSDSNIYFDTSGCCGADTQRINANIDTFPDFVAAETGDVSWWTNKWHHFVFEKKGDQKDIYIDGKLFLTGANSAALPTDFTTLYLGADNTGVGNVMHGQVDDFAVYGTALAEADVQKLFTGTAPGALGAGAKLMAFWDFNTGGVVPPTGVKATISKNGANITIQWTPTGGTLESSPTLGTSATWTAVGTTNPATIAVGTGKAVFYRIRQ